MKNYKKTFLGSILTFFVGISCCWLSSLVIWIGGASLIGTMVSFIEEIQIPLICLGVIFLIVTIILYLRKKKTVAR